LPHSIITVRGAADGLLGCPDAGASPDTRLVRLRVRETEGGRMSSRDNNDTSESASTSFAIDGRELDERTTVVSVAGELDLSTAPQLKWLLMDALEEGRSMLVVDLSQTTFMDSTALGVLVGVNRSLGDGGQLTLVCEKANLLRVFELSGMDGVFTICATLDDALAYTSRRAAEAG
jgi:anti-sigma B factor antagonist